jgi:hypothetical protein
MKDYLGYALSLLLISGAIGLGLGLAARLLMLAWHSAPSTKRREAEHRADFEFELRAFSDAVPPSCHRSARSVDE